MCGFCGFVDLSGAGNSGSHGRILEKMTNQIAHRGPDDSGQWLEPDIGLALGHRRLSIVDLSPEGHQPMVSEAGRYVIVFNGEIYNYRDVRKKLESGNANIGWRGHSDTEVMLAAIEQWGVQQALVQFNGMFAFALWDRQERKLYLARDRLGEKPLYYGWSNGVLLFGSELKSLRAHPAWQGHIDRDALTLYMRHNYIPAPYCIYSNIKKLPPASLLTIIPEKGVSQVATPELYWSAFNVAESSNKKQFRFDDAEAITQLDGLLRKAVAMRMEADVPLGAFLSGGVDSSTIVALMQAQSSRPVRSFSIGFSEKEYNEAEHARAVAQHLGTEHTELIVTPEQAMAVVPRLPHLYDEPFSDASQIPTFLVSEMARRHVTVSLSGDGGDELFGGYTRYFWGMKIWNKVKWMPPAARFALAKMINSLKPQTWDELFIKLNHFLPASAVQRMPGDKLQKLADVLRARSPELMYQSLVSQWQFPENVVLRGKEPMTNLNDRSRWPQVCDFVHYMMYQDMVGYMPDDILTKVDRASMGVSLEARVPLLDQHIVEFAWQVPTEMKIRNGQGKWLLRQVLYKYVPRELIERPKMGFAIPIDSWLRGPLRDWAEGLIDRRTLDEQGYFDTDLIHRTWNEHLSGKRNWQYRLWGVLMFQAWLESEHTIANGGK